MTTGGAKTTTTPPQAAPKTTSCQHNPRCGHRAHHASRSAAENTPAVSYQVSTPARPNKRRHQATVSPITARSESRSPRAKQRPVLTHRQSPPIITAVPAVDAVNVTVTISSGQANAESQSGSVSPSQLAVPRITAEPPCPSQLPMPPMHWMGGDDEKCPAQRQHCRAATKSLLSHLTNSGILVTA